MTLSPATRCLCFDATPSIQHDAFSHLRQYPIEVQEEILGCIERYAKPIGFCSSLEWLAFRVVNAIKTVFSYLGCCSSDWQKTLWRSTEKMAQTDPSKYPIAPKCNQEWIELQMSFLLEFEDLSRSNGWTAEQVKRGEPMIKEQLSKMHKTMDMDYHWARLESGALAAKI